MAIRTSADIRAEIAELSDACQALLDVAQAEDRELTEEQVVLFNENMEKIGSSSTVDKKGSGYKLELEEAEKFEQKKRHLAETRMLQSVPLNPPGGVRISTQRNASDRISVKHRLGPTRAFKGDSGHRDAYSSGMWLRSVLARDNRTVDEEADAWLQSVGWDVRMTATEGTPSGGGYLVPTPLSNAIIDVRTLAGVSRQLARVVPMTAETLKVAKKSAGTTVYYPGEAGATTASEQTWGEVQLTAKKRAILSKVSQELRDDAIIAVMDDLASQMGTDFAVKEDSEFIDGDGTSTYGNEVGLKAAILAGGVYTTPANINVWSEITLPMVMEGMAKLPSKYRPFQKAWLCSSQFYFSVLARLLAEAGGNTIASLQSGDGGRYQFFGDPVFFSDFMPTADADSTIHAFYGAFGQAAMIGDRTGVQLATSEHLGFAEDVISLRATTRYDINVHDFGSSSAAGAYIALKTNAA